MLNSIVRPHSRLLFALLLPVLPVVAQDSTALHDRKSHPALTAPDAAAAKAAAAPSVALAAATAKPAVSAPLPAAPAKPAVASSDFMTEAPNEQSVHITVGRSMFLSTKHRLTRVYVTNPAVVESYTASANQVVLTAKGPGVASVILWDEAGEQQDFLVSAEADIDMLRESLQKALPNEHIQLEQRAGRILVSGTVGTDTTSDAIMKLATPYAKDISNAVVVDSAKVKQVELKVRVLEVDRNKIGQFAFNFFNGGGNNIAQTTTGQFSSNPTVTQGGSSCAANSTTCKTVSVSSALNYFLFSNKFNIGATIQDLETMQLAQILAEPTISTMSGQKANFLAGGEFPFPVVSNAGGVSNVSIQFRPYGVKLEFTPVVNADGTIDLKVAPEVSALDYTNAVTISGYTIPALSSRRAETRVVLNSGQTFAIAGLLDQRTTDQFAKTPGIATVPILGELFKSKSTTHSRTELIVMVTPTLVDPVNAPPPPPEQPKLPVKLLDKNDYDNTIPKVRKP
jgi:pilus assembly protein CpaC